MNSSILNLDRRAIERQLRDDFDMALAAWATCVPADTRADSFVPYSNIPMP